MLEEIARDAERIIVKIGSDLVNQTNIQCYAEDIAGLKADGKDIVVVSSGAIKNGKMVTSLHMAEGMARNQALAAVGQIPLAQMYESALASYNLHAAPILVTRGDLDVLSYAKQIPKRVHQLFPISEYIATYTPDRPVSTTDLDEADRELMQPFIQLLNGKLERHYRLKQTMEALLHKEHNVIPIMNENDTLAIEEISFGDNDALAAYAANAFLADLLVILTSVDGVYDRAKYEAGTKQVIEHIDNLDYFNAQVVNEQTPNGKGGMASKAGAARIASNIPLLIANGNTPHILRDMYCQTITGTYVRL
ncbi:hypothetical protein H6504_02525 [Candidatus Woesearchaeota archaeon]|nr:hypothetical protein [Candidatus Woesearchaeota archaeon]